MIHGMAEVAMGNYQKDNVYVCKEGDTGWKKFAASEPGDNYLFQAEDAIPSYEDYYLFDIINPVEVLTGTQVAKVAEVGPFVFQSWSIGIDMELVDEADGGKSVQYNYAQAHIFLDEDVVVTTNHGNPNSDKQEYTFESRAPPGVTKHMQFNQFSVGYLGALGLAGSEFPLFLIGNGCTETQIANVVSACESWEMGR